MAELSRPIDREDLPYGQVCIETLSVHTHREINDLPYGQVCIETEEADEETKEAEGPALRAGLYRNHY